MHGFPRSGWFCMYVAALDGLGGPLLSLLKETCQLLPLLWDAPPLAPPQPPFRSFSTWLTIIYGIWASRCCGLVCEDAAIMLTVHAWQWQHPSRLSDINWISGVLS